jgi:hypothetical protein
MLSTINKQLTVEDGYALLSPFLQARGLNELSAMNRRSFRRRY